MLRFFPFFPKNYFFCFIFFSFLQIILSSRLVVKNISLLSRRPFCCIHQEEYTQYNTITSTMGGVLSVPGGGGPAVEDVVALAESNDVPYAIPLPVNEVRLRRLLLLRRRLFLIVPNVVIKYLIIPMSKTIPNASSSTKTTTTNRATRKCTST